MPADLDQLLRDAVRDPDPFDVDELWASGRRRRLVRRIVAASSAIAVVAVVGIGAGSLAGALGAGQLEIDPATEGDDVPEPEAPAEDPADDASEPGDVEEQDNEVEDPPNDDQHEQIEDVDEQPDVEDQQTETVPVTPTPDPAAVAEPCAAHQGREGEAFVAIAAPVAGQQVDDVIELVGCANVYEATVRYRLTDGSGGVLADDFTTATCGSGCAGEFRETIAVEGVTGQLVLTVFWEDAGDGSERDIVEVVLEAG